MRPNKELMEKCTCQIVRLFYYDSITLLDKVLSDNIDDPEYSANTARNRLEMVLTYYNLKNENKISSIVELLKQIGYSAEDISILQVKCERETQRHIKLRETATDIPE